MDSWRSSLHYLPVFNMTLTGRTLSGPVRFVWDWLQCSLAYVWNLQYLCLSHPLTSWNNVMQVCPPLPSSNESCNEEKQQTSYSVVSFAHIPVAPSLRCSSFRWSPATRFHCCLLYWFLVRIVTILLHPLEQRILVRKIAHEVLSLIGYRAHCKLREHILTIGFAGLTSTMITMSDGLCCYSL